jgi:hypothetical protein
MVVVIKKNAKRKEIDRVLRSIKPKKTGKLLNAKKYCGILKVNGDPLEIQKKLRDEWK